MKGFEKLRLLVVAAMGTVAPASAMAASLPTSVPTEEVRATTSTELMGSQTEASLHGAAPVGQGVAYRAVTGSVE